MRILVSTRALRFVLLHCLLKWCVASSMTAKRFAVCITGQVGRFDELSLATKVENYLEPLSELFEVDVILVVSENEKLLSTNAAFVTSNTTTPYGAQWSREQLTFTLEAAALGGQVVFVNWTQPHSPLVNKHYVQSLRNEQMADSRLWQYHRAQNHLRQFATAHKCMMEIDRLEIKESFRYTGVARLREDAYIPFPVDWKSILSKLGPNDVASTECESWGGVNDKGSIMLREAAARYFSAPTVSYLFHPEESVSNIQNPEQFWKNSLKINNLKVVQLTTDELIIMRLGMHKDHYCLRMTFGALESCNIDENSLDVKVCPQYHDAQMAKIVHEAKLAREKEERELLLHNQTIQIF